MNTRKPLFVLLSIALIVSVGCATTWERVQVPGLKDPPPAFLAEGDQSARWIPVMANGTLGQPLRPTDPGTRKAGVWIVRSPSAITSSLTLVVRTDENGEVEEILHQVSQNGYLTGIFSAATISAGAIAAAAVLRPAKVTQTANPSATGGAGGAGGSTGAVTNTSSGNTSTNTSTSSGNTSTNTSTSSGNTSTNTAQGGAGGAGGAGGSATNRNCGQGTTVNSVSC